MALLTVTGLGTCLFSSPSRLSISPIQCLSQSLSATSLGSSPLSASSRSVSVAYRSTPITVICGRGDKRTKRGKRFKHSYGNARPRNKTKGKGPLPAPTPPNPYKKKYEPESTYSELEEAVESVPDFEE